ncbi:MAG: acyltransferase, partial [Gemmatimonadota bacterium]|nr:acyltransferase [Gemmatimonadota bacterium]
LTKGIPADLGVTLFFVLSGFLITWLLLREFDENGTISIRTFYVRRTLRIFPAYYAFALFSLALDTALGHRWTIGLITVTFTYLVNYYNAFLGHPTTSVAHAWSLAVEEQFYLLWPLACLALMKRSRLLAMTTVGGVVLAVVAWRSWLTLGAHASHSYVYNAFDTRCDALAIGCFVALAADRSWFQTFERAIRLSPVFPLITLGLLYLSQHFGSTDYHYSVGMTVDALFLAIMVVQLIGLAKTRPWSWLDSPLARWLGLISYPSYLYHAWGLSVGNRLLPHANLLMRFVAGYGATICLAWLSYTFIERRFLALKDRLTPALSSSEQGIVTKTARA